MLFSLPTFTILRNMPDKSKFMLRCLLTVRRSFLCVGIHILYLRWSLDFPQCNNFFMIPPRPTTPPPRIPNKRTVFSLLSGILSGLKKKLKWERRRGEGTFITVLSYSSSFYILWKQFYFPWSHTSFPILFQSTHICYMYFFPRTFFRTLSIYAYTVFI